MAGSPKQYPHYDAEGQLALRQSNAEAFAGHLARCGVAPVAAKLAVLVFERGEKRRIGEDDLTTFTISSRKAAELIGCSDRAVPQGAATLSKLGWFRELSSGRGKPPTYVLDVAAAASMPTPEQVLADSFSLVASTPVRTSAHLCAPLRSAPRVIENDGLENPCSHSNRVHTTGSTSHFAPDRTASHQFAAGDRELPPYPWARRGGVTDAELIAAVRGGVLELLRYLFDHAVTMRWIQSSDDTWLRFLTGCHHCASAKLTRRMGRMVTFVKGVPKRRVPPLDVSRFAHRSEDWAAQLIAKQHRDPALSRLGRMVREDE